MEYQEGLEMQEAAGGTIRRILQVKNRLWLPGTMQLLRHTLGNRPSSVGAAGEDTQRVQNRFEQGL